MIVRNQIVSYFVDQSDPPRVFMSPVTMSSEVASKIIQSELNGFSKAKLSGKKLLHVCFDRDSEIIYLPNAYRFTKEQLEPLLLAAKYYIQLGWGGYKMVPPIEGSPFSSLRVRSVKSFGYVYDSIREHFDDDVNDLVVIEANLSRMTATVKQLPPIYKNNKNYSGGIINSQVTFIDEIDLKGKRRDKPIRLLTVEPPFILIDISPSVEVTSTEKEWAVLSGYRDYVSQYKNVIRENDFISSFAPLYAAKRYLYMGWTFEEVCKVLLECVKDFGGLMKGIRDLLSTAERLSQEGCDNHAKDPYYIAFKIDSNTFPLDFRKDNRNPIFSIEYYDPESHHVIIRSVAFVDSDLCFKILKSKSRPYIVKYNTHINKIDVKVQDSIHRELSAKTNIPIKIKNMILKENNLENVDFRSDKRSRSISLSSNEFCNVRMMSDYHYAKDHIEVMCKERGVDFEDIQVVVGPIERIFGRGVQGGFMGEEQFKKSKLKTPFQIEKGLYVNPPIIAVNSESMPSYAAQTETLIHEYSHKLYSIMNPCHEHLYNKDKGLKDRDPRKYWDLYLGDEDEKLAHQEEIKFELISGKSVDEIVRDKIGGAITQDNSNQTYITAITFKEMVDQVVEKMEDVSCQLQEEN